MKLNISLQHVNKFLNCYFKSYLIDEPQLATDNHIHDDTGHRKTRAAGQVPGPRAGAHGPNKAATQMVSGGFLILFLLLFIVSHSYIDVFEYFEHFQVILWCQLIGSIILKPIISNLQRELYI